MEKIKNYLLSRPGCQEDFPFGPTTAVFKIKGKMFALLSDQRLRQTASAAEPCWWLNLKCEPQQALILRDIFPSVIAGYHMNKRHWNTVILDGSVPQGEIERMIDHSFVLVVNGLAKKDRQSILLHL